MPLTKIPKSGSMLTGVVVLTPNNFNAANVYTGILYAHGIGQRGDGSATNVAGWMQTEAQKLIELIGGSNHILIAPELYFNQNWTPNYFDFALQYLTSHYKVGAKVFIDGVSLGGQEIWAWGSMNNSKLLGIHATCAVNKSVDFCAIKCPILAHHAQNDPTVPYNEGMIAINAIKACGGNATMQPFGGRHEIWKSDQWGQSVYEQQDLKTFFGIGSSTPPPPEKKIVLQYNLKNGKTHVIYDDDSYEDIE